MVKKCLAFRSFLLIIFLLSLVLQGCSFFRYIDGSSKEEMKRFYTNKEELWAEIQNEKEKADVRMLEFEYRLARSDREIESLKNVIYSGKREIQRDLAVSEGDIKSLKVKVLSGNSDINKSLKVKVLSGNGDINKSLKVKVLSGNGDINSAHKMASRLIKMGYKIKLVDYAPTSNFEHDTVFYASRSQSKGEALVSHLGGNTALKPISWPSIYDLMVVTGKN